MVTRIVVFVPETQIPSGGFESWLCWLSQCFVARHSGVFDKQQTHRNSIVLHRHSLKRTVSPCVKKLVAVLTAEKSKQNSLKHSGPFSHCCKLQNIVDFKHLSSLLCGTIHFCSRSVHENVFLSAICWPGASTYWHTFTPLPSASRLTVHRSW